MLELTAGREQPPHLACPAISATASSSDAQRAAGSAGFSAPCLNRGLSLELPSAEATGGGVTLHGSGDYDACYASAVELLRKDFNGWCDYNHMGQCALVGVYVPPVVAAGRFHAFSGFTELYTFLGLAGDDDLHAVAAAGRSFCALSWDEVSASNKAARKPWDETKLQVWVCGGRLSVGW